jgi:type IV pilus assembly protein PilZ
MWTTTTDEASKANPAGMGIEFQYADDTERKEMEKIVEQLAVGHLGEHIADKLLGKK